MNKKFSDDTISKDFNGKIESVRGPPGAPIGYGVHKLAIEGGAPYAAKKTVEEPAPGIQHQPVILPADFYRGEKPVEEELSPEMAYRKKVGEEGLRAANVDFSKMVAAGMTDTPKAKWGKNSILNDIEKAAEAKKNNGLVPELNPD